MVRVQILLLLVSLLCAVKCAPLSRYDFLSENKVYINITYPANYKRCNDCQKCYPNRKSYVKTAPSDKYRLFERNTYYQDFFTAMIIFGFSFHVFGKSDSSTQTSVHKSWFGCDIAEDPEKEDDVSDKSNPDSLLASSKIMKENEVSDTNNSASLQYQQTGDYECHPSIPNQSKLVYQLDISITYHSKHDVFKDNLPTSICNILAETLSSKVIVESFQHINNDTQEYCLNFIFLIFEHHENLYRLSAPDTQKLVKKIKLFLKEELDSASSYVTYWHYQNLDNDRKCLKDLTITQILEIGKSLTICWEELANLMDKQLEESQFSEFLLRQDGDHTGEFLSLLQKRYPLLTANRFKKILLQKLLNCIQHKNINEYLSALKHVLHLTAKNTRIKDLRMQKKLEFLKFLKGILDQFEGPEKVCFWRNLLEEFEGISYDDLEQHVKKRKEAMSNPGAELITILKYHQPDVPLKTFLETFVSMI